MDGILKVFLFVIAAGLCYYLSVLVHELGHVFAAKLVGWRPWELCIGEGRKKTLFTADGIRFRLGTGLKGGRVHAFSRSAERFKFAQFLFAAGGPLATTILAGLLWVAASINSRRNFVSDPWEGGLWMLCFFECWLLVINLWPCHFSLDGMNMPSDGLQMWRALWMKQSEVEKRHTEHCFGLVYTLFKEGLLADAGMELSRMSAQNDLGAEERRGLNAFWVHLLLEAGHEERAANECSRLLQTSEHDPDEYVRMLDSLACIPLFYGQKGVLVRALEYIDEAISLAPGLITLKGTKGALLIENGDPHLGLELVNEVLTESESKNDQAIAAYYIALAYHKCGEITEAQEALRTAKAENRNCIVAARVEQEICTSPSDDPLVEIVAS